MNGKNILSKKFLACDSHRAVSPILATVLLLGITVVGGGLAFTLLSQGTNTASSQNIITLENAQAVKGTSHSDLTATIKNGGSKPWKTIEMTVAKTELSEPLLYESLHENVMGCIDANGANANCNTAGSKTAKNLDNPLRSQWVAHLDKAGGATNIADKGEGISAGRKFVLSTDEPAIRTTIVPRSTSVYNLITGNGTDGASNNITSGEGCALTTSFTDCTTLFNALDPISGSVFCKQITLGDVECKVATHRQLSASVSSGQSVQIYADAFTKSVPNLNNSIVNIGDALVTNIVTTAEDGSSARIQTIIKVTGI